MVPVQDWELLWAPADEGAYADVLSYLTPEDVVLDIGAGDLRLARRMASVAAKVFAIELNTFLLADPVDLPANLVLLPGDARTLSYPAQITTAVLLMRHCRHFQLYADRLKAVGCRQLLTNARWGMGVERVDLWQPRRPFTAVAIGWYACWCGATGFIPGPPDIYHHHDETVIHEVAHCPHCRPDLSPADSP